MSPFQLYIGVTREVRKFKDDLVLSSADITYWLNKALEEFVDTRYRNLDKDEEVRKDLKTLIVEDSPLTPDSSSTIFEGTTGYVFLNAVLPSDLRYIIREIATISIDEVNTIVGVKPIQLDRLNFKLKDPYSEHRINFNTAHPLRYEQDTNIILVTTTDYSVVNYTISYIKTPVKFVIADSEDTAEYSELTSKTHNKLITIATRMIIENESNPRYQTVSIEEQKS